MSHSSRSITTGRATFGLLALVVVLLLGVLVPTPALAHEFGPDIRVRFEPFPSVLDDVTIEIVTSIAPQLAIGNPTDDVLEVLDDDGIAFFRIGPDGAEANFDNGDFYLTQDPLGALAIPQRARGSGEPGTWGLIAAKPEWAWFDHRMHPQAVARLRVPEPSEEGTILSTFEIPIRFRGESVLLRGSIVQQPQTGRLVGALTGRPDVEGVSVQLLPGGTPGIFLSADPDREVVVLGRDGEPFLRFAGGTVEANVLSPAWYDSGRAARADESQTVVLDPAAPPQWEQVSNGPRFGWVEARALYGRGTPDDELLRDAVDQTLVTWEVPILVDGERESITGETRFELFDTFRDEPASGAARWVPIGLGLLGIAAIAAVITRRRRTSHAA